MKRQSAIVITHYRSVIKCDSARRLCGQHCGDTTRSAWTCALVHAHASTLPGIFPKALGQTLKKRCRNAGSLKQCTDWGVGRALAWVCVNPHAVYSSSLPPQMVAAPGLATLQSECREGHPVGDELELPSQLARFTVADPTGLAATIQ